MKKIWLISPFGSVIRVSFLSSMLLLLSACGTQPSSTSSTPEASLLLETPPIQQERKPSNYSYTRQMLKPSPTEMTNWTAMNEGFKEQRTTGYLITQDLVKDTKECFTPSTGPDATIRWVTLLTQGRENMQQRPLQPTELFSGNSITISGYRKAAPLVSLPNTVKKQLESRGWTITSLSGLYNYYPFNYSRAAATNISTSEERNTIAGEIGGAIEENARFPFNTLLITDDLLLHVFHKLFDNGLKYYEEQIARPTLTTLSEKLYKQYLNLSQDTYLKDNNWIDLLEIYDFLAAYRAIPHIFLPTNQELIEASTTRSSAMDMDLKTDLTDENIQNIIQKRTQTIAKTLAPTYQTLIPQIVEKILKADKDGANDEFLAILARKDLQSGDITLQQDYTQFKPRSHYTDSSLLKTYFMAMKWLMREKFYFNSKSLTLAAMVMSSTIPENDVKSLNQLSEQIKNLIGGDDDLTLNEMRDYLKQYGRINLPSGIIGTARPWEQIIEQLAALHPQKIQSTHYQADCLECITEDIAKQTTDGFVFFGEKFTLDSYLFDLTTAGSAEKEFAEKPNIQTAFIVPTILENSPLADQFVKLRLTEKAPHSILEDEGHTQLSSWDTIKAFAKEKVAQLIGTGLARSNSEAITHNIYHQRLQMLGLLLQAPLENAPYFRLDPVYALKNLITYLGSYTELKHDTLLYVKQAYAEMGGGGDDLCSIYVANPPLPVPKGYVESEPDFLDTLIKLNAETLPYFSGTYEQEKFREFGNILTKLKDISIKQMHNEIIDDADFEWLRLLPSWNGKFTDIILPTKTIGEPTLKEARAALIADIFTSENDGPLYEAVGRPALMLLMVNDVNGTRVVVWPVFTHYEFYETDGVLEGEGSRFTDEDRQEQIENETEDPFYSSPTPVVNRTDKGLSIVSKALRKALEKVE